MTKTGQAKVVSQGGGGYINRNPKYVKGFEPFKASDLKDDVPRGTLVTAETVRFLSNQRALTK